MKQKILLAVVGLVAVIGLYALSVYNGLATKTNAIEGQWAQVETQYQRRVDLIPNLVESTKGVMAQEKEVFGLIADARSRYAGATNTNEKAQAASELETGLGRLLVVMENYPQLNSNQTVASLMDELAGTENRVAVERKRFNELVQSYNGTVRMFPTNLIAGLFGYQQKEYFQSETGAEKAPKVDLTN